MLTTLGDDVDSNDDPTIKQMARDGLRDGRSSTPSSCVGKTVGREVNARQSAKGRYTTHYNHLMVKWDE
jgi:hypothetical protein